MLRFERVHLMSVLAFWLGVTAVAAQTQESKLRGFLETTGFDVALESIRLSASSAPDLIGMRAEDFGATWTALTRDIFDTNEMHDMALAILDKTLKDDLLDHATEFYASDLGQRLVAAENASHLKEQDDLKAEAGEAIVAGLVRAGSARLEHLRRMNQASDSAGIAIRAIQEIQVRFLMAASAAGVIELQLDEPEMRALLAAQESELRVALQASALSGAAYTYQAFSDDEVAAYADALEHPKMRAVYDLMNAVQFEIMANRFEALAAAMAKLQPSTDL